MRLYLIRHGQSVNNALYAEGRDKERHHEPELTEIGQKQAQNLAQYLAKTPDMPLNSDELVDFTHLYCSPMIRAMETARPIAEALNLSPQVWHDIIELGGLFTVKETNEEKIITGYPGLSRSEIEARFPGYHLPDELTEEGWWHARPEIEAAPDFTARALRVVHALKERAHTDERIALVSHAGFIDLLIKALLSQIPTHPNTLYYTHYNTGITRVDFDEGYMNSLVINRLRLHYVNRVTHLSSDLWTW